MSTIADLVVRVQALVPHIEQAITDAHAAGKAEADAVNAADVAAMDTAVAAAEAAVTPVVPPAP